MLQAAGNISNEAAETKLRAVQLNDEAEQLSNDVDGATLNLEKYEQQAEEDARLVQEVGGVLKNSTWLCFATTNIHAFNNCSTSICGVNC